MKYFFISLILLSCLSCDSSLINVRESKKTTVITKDASGAVIEKMIFHYDAETRIHRDIRYGKGNMVEHHATQKYDENRNVVESIWYKDEANIDTKIVYVYNESGECIGSKQYDANNNCQGRAEDLFLNGRNVGTVFYNSDGTIKFKILEDHDEVNRIRKSKYVNAKDEVYKTTVQKYNEDGRGTYYYYEKPDGSNRRTIIEFDERGNRRKIDTYKNGELVSQHAFDITYDELGRIKLEKRMPYDGKPHYCKYFYKGIDERTFKIEVRDKEEKIIRTTECFYK